jgi:hypothetical protein
MPCWL